MKNIPLILGFKFLFCLTKHRTCRVIIIFNNICKNCKIFVNHEETMILFSRSLIFRIYAAGLPHQTLVSYYRSSFHRYNVAFRYRAIINIFCSINIFGRIENLRQNISILQFFVNQEYKSCKILYIDTKYIFKCPTKQYRNKV